jgi:phospholipid transport system substrate-binding protein
MSLSTKGFRLTTFWKVGCVFLLFWPPSVWAVESPLETVRQATDQAVAILHDPALKDHVQERREKFWQTVLPKFDVQEISKRCLGPQWNTITEKQRQEFTQLFVELVKRSYQNTLEHQTKDAQFSFDQERVEGDDAEVETRILGPAQEKALAVNYRLHQVGGRWRIYDVVAENVSLVRNYHTQFDRILKSSSYDGLVQTIRKKVQDPQA